MEIGAFIHAKRLEKGFTLTELAKMVGVSHVTIIRWERGDTKTLKNDKCVALARALGISPLDLLDSPNEQEQSMLYQYRLLTSTDKAEILALIDYKLSHYPQKKGETK